METTTQQSALGNRWQESDDDDNDEEEEEEEEVRRVSGVQSACAKYHNKSTFNRCQKTELPNTRIWKWKM